MHDAVVTSFRKLKKKDRSKQGPKGENCLYNDAMSLQKFVQVAVDF